MLGTDARFACISIEFPWIPSLMLQPDLEAVVHAHSGVCLSGSVMQACHIHLGRSGFVFQSSAQYASLPLSSRLAIVRHHDSAPEVYAACSDTCPCSHPLSAEQCHIDLLADAPCKQKMQSLSLFMRQGAIDNGGKRSDVIVPS